MARSEWGEEQVCRSSDLESAEDDARHGRDRRRLAVLLEGAGDEAEGAFDFEAFFFGDLFH